MLLQAWAMLEWLDGIYGRLFSYLENSPLGKNTYVMIMSDNGPQLLVGEKDDLHKMVSGSYNHDIWRACSTACLRYAPVIAIHM
jgi:arylsulfatase A-like enzyme